MEMSRDLESQTPSTMMLLAGVHSCKMWHVIESRDMLWTCLLSLVEMLSSSQR